jgi:hypothetical protein
VIGEAIRLTARGCLFLVCLPEDQGVGSGLYYMKLGI